MRKLNRFLLRAICTGLLVLLTGLFLTAQNAPVTTIATVANAVPGQVQVPVTVTGFTNIGAVSLYLEYEYAGLHFVQGASNPLLGGLAMNDVDLGNGKHRIIIGWFGFGVTLLNGSTMVTLTFTYISGITAIQFNDNGSSCEYADANLNVLNDIPTSSYYINGYVCGSINNPGQITGITNVCQGTSGLNYSVQPLSNATGYSWSVPTGATITSGNNTNAITVNFSSGAVSGNITVNGVNNCGNGPVSQLPITVNPLPIANAGPDVSIPYGTNTTLNAAPGGTGSFQYHWAPEVLVVNPNLQSSPTVNLTVTSLFTLNVKNLATQCTNSDDIVVTITGGALHTNPVCSPGSICRGTIAQLFANAGGGSGSYSYAWSCIPPGSPPWSSNIANPMISPDSSKIYNLTVSDGFNTSQGATALNVFQLPSATISGGDTLCGEGQSTVLTVDFTGTPPWTFYYTNGSQTWYIQGVVTSPYYITAILPGVYTIPAMNDFYCTGMASGSAAVGVFPIPPTPTISTNGVNIFSSGCCGNQWYKDGVIIPGATAQACQPIGTGNYFTIVTVNGCVSDTSNVIYFIMTGQEQFDRKNYFSVWPNPTRNFVTIHYGPGAPSILEVSIYSVTGSIIKRVVPCSKTYSERCLINIQDVLAGFYLLEVVSNSGINILKLVIK